MLKVDLFVFPDQLPCEGRLKLNKEADGCYRLSYSVENLTREVFVNPQTIADGNVAMAMFIPLTGQLIVHYGYSQLCESLNMTHSEFLSITSNIGFMQLDRYKDRVFIKVFLPKGQYSLDSDTDSYADNAYLTADCCHPLDWQYMPTYDLIEAKVERGRLLLTLGICRPTIEEAQDGMHINYAGQVLPLNDGIHTYAFDFVLGENAYIGYPYSRRKGRMIDVARAVMLCIK